jgi:hypothetical protein
MTIPEPVNYALTLEDIQAYVDTCPDAVVWQAGDLSEGLIAKAMSWKYTDRQWMASTQSISRQLEIGKDEWKLFKERES